MRHLHYETAPENLYKLSNPMVIANFDLNVSTFANTAFLERPKLQLPKTSK